MATDIRDCLNSDYIYSGNKFRKKPVIWVYVEDEIDRVFWDSFLHPFAMQRNCKFNISIVREHEKTLTGKTSVLSYKNPEDLGPYMWICIDSDLDEVLDNFSKFSKVIKENKYIITTWWYSVENLKCFPDLLRADVIKASFVEECTIDFAEIFGDISKIYKDIFLLLLVMKANNDNSFRLKDFCRCLSFVKFTSDGLDKSFVEEKVKKWIDANKNLLGKYEAQFDAWICKLAAMGFTEYNYYQLYNGHGLYKHIAKPLVLFFTRKYRTNKLTAIANGSDSEKRKMELIAKYYNDTFTSRQSDGLKSLSSRIEQLITDNTPDYNCSASVKIREQIENALA